MGVAAFEEKSGGQGERTGAGDDDGGGGDGGGDNGGDKGDGDG